MPVVFIPALLRSLAGGQRQATVSGATVSEVIDALDALYPGMRARLVEGDRLRPGLAVSIDDSFGKRGLSEPVPPDSEVHFFPAIAGG